MRARTEAVTAGELARRGSLRNRFWQPPFALSVCRFCARKSAKRSEQPRTVNISYPPGLLLLLLLLLLVFTVFEKLKRAPVIGCQLSKDVQ
ncbi:hypothetical protein F2P81_021524 [Scophthalmus maximus]|uniref:Uncharacterized protein n=1 Tax=Scophthalmus maximus TaxID=52904 RepID=A0A6A4S1D9_SCOMX|nr:hypothetical protein F2P81_021524 [Scophthalmus maximus]